MHAPCPGRYDMHMHTAEHAAATFQPSTSNPAAQPTCQHAIMPTSCHHHRAPYTRPRQDGNARRAHTKKANKQSAASQNALQSDKDHSGASPSNGEHSPCGLTADALKACGRLHWGRRRAGSRSACDLSSGVACRPEGTRRERTIAKGLKRHAGAHPRSPDIAISSGRRARWLERGQPYFSTLSRRVVQAHLGAVRDGDVRGCVVSSGAPLEAFSDGALPPRTLGLLEPTASAALSPPLPCRSYACDAERNEARDTSRLPCACATD